MIENGICCIFGAGEYHGPPPVLPHDAFVIAADGGYSYIARHGLRADMLVGDFDSLVEIPRHECVRVLPQEKDDTDMLAAIRAGEERGCRVFHIYGGTGGRLDHTLANIQCVAGLAGRGARGFLHGRDTAITAIRDGELRFPAGCSGVISVFSHSDSATGVYERGLKYPLCDATLDSRRPLGVSNEFTGEPATVSVRSGTLVVIYPQNITEN